MNLPVALITGSSRGIGRAIAVELAGDGYSVVVNYANNAAAAGEVVQAIQSAGGRAIAVRASIAVSDDRRRLIDRTMQEWGRLDVLVNNAGITSPGRQDMLEASEEDWNLVFDTNLKGPFFLAQAAAKVMIDAVQCGTIPNGKIINISSISAYAISTDRADYCMAKAAMGAMTWLLADRLAGEGITVFEVCPGIIATDMTAPVKEKYDRLIEEGLTPIRRWGKPEDVARAVAAIVNDNFPFSTGDRFNIDGGFHIRRL